MNPRFPTGARDLVVARMHEALRQGRWAPGAVLDVTALAAEFQLSPSPVREGLSLLLGARVLEASHRNGFSLPRLMPYELADEYRLLGVLADAVAEDPSTPFVADAHEPQRLERLIRSLARRSGASPATPMIAATMLRIAPYLRAEQMVFGDCESEAAEFARLAVDPSRALLRRALRHAVQRRMAGAAHICRAADSTPKSFEKALE